jgi:hypothetical protein
MRREEWEAKAFHSSQSVLLADGLAILAADATSFAAGDAVRVHLLSGEAGMLEEGALQTNAPVD